jgi:putative NADH-flavin reductase
MATEKWSQISPATSVTLLKEIINYTFCGDKMKREAGGQGEISGEF